MIHSLTVVVADVVPNIMVEKFPEIDSFVMVNVRQVSTRD